MMSEKLKTIKEQKKDRRTEKRLLTKNVCLGSIIR